MTSPLRIAIPSITCGIGTLLVLSPLYLSLPQQMEMWATRQEIAQRRQEKETEIINESQLTQTQIEQRDKVARLAARRKQAVPNRTLRMSAYIYEQGRPPQQISTKGYLDSDHIQVYDASGQCVGDIYKRKFRFIDKYSDVCNKPPVQTTGEEIEQVWNN